jgi:hypothetical protein
MKKLYLVNLTVDERGALTQLVKRDRVSGLKRLRASILLKADEGLTDQEIADDLEAGVVTVERVRRRCCARGLEASPRRAWRRGRGSRRGTASPGGALVSFDLPPRIWSDSVRYASHERHSPAVAGSGDA